MTIPLNEQQERAIKDWAADDRLWTTQETVEFNLRVFARVILKAVGEPMTIESKEDFLRVAREMIATARTRFRAMADPIAADDETREKIIAFEHAIGEVSPEVALEALLQWMADTGRHPKPALAVGTRVAFAHMPGSIQTVVSIAPDGMVEISGFSGLFSPHLFVVVDAT